MAKEKMLSLIVDSMSIRIVFSIALAGACAYLYMKIKKRDAAKALHDDATVAEEPITVDAAFDTFGSTYFPNNKIGLESFIKSKLTLDEPVEELVEVVESGEILEDPEKPPVKVEKKKRKTSKRSAKTKINLDLSE